MDALNRIVGDVRAAGGELVVLSPQAPEHSRKMVDRQGLGFEILHDEGLAVAERFGIAFELPEDLVEVYSAFGLDLPKVNGEDRWRAPMPARYVVDMSGTIRDAEVNPDYTRRPEPEATLEVLREVLGG